jgi:hypothetical protein
MRRAISLAALAATCGCAATDPAAPEPPTAPGQCSAEAAQSLIGQPGTSALAVEALRRTHLRTVRWIWPGQAVTMDYRADRLDISLDADGKVARLTCG